MESVDDFLVISSISGIAHFAEKRPAKGYFHHYLVYGEAKGNIVEYSGYSINLVMAGGRVLQRGLDMEQIKEAIKEGTLYWIDNPKYPKTRLEKSLARARMYERLGEERYIVTSNNCEHLVLYILTGFPISEQIRYATPFQLVIFDIIQSTVVDYKIEFLRIAFYSMIHVSFSYIGNLLVENLHVTPGINARQLATLFALGAIDSYIIWYRTEELTQMKQRLYVNDIDFEREVRNTVCRGYVRAGAGVIGESISYNPYVGFAMGTMIGNIAGPVIGSPFSGYIC